MYEYVGADHWERTTVFDLARWKNGLAFKNINFSETGRPVIKIAELKSGITNQTKFTNGVYDESLFVKSGDMLFSWSGNPDTSIDVFRWEGPEGWLNQHIYKVTPHKGVDEGFLFFLLRWLRPRFAEIARNKQTTGLGHVTLKDFKNMAVGLPNDVEQLAIVSFVGPFQDKIELNRRTNETLEAMARAIFKDWFVDFGPTSAKAEGRAPYLAADLWDLFPDALDEEGKPEGWHHCTLADLAIHHRATVSPTDNPECLFEHYSIPAYDAGQEPALDLGASIRSIKTVIPAGAVLLSKLNPDIPRAWIPNFSNDRPQVSSTEFLAFTPKSPATRSLLYCLFRDSVFRREMEAMVTGTSKSHQRVSPKALVQRPVLLGTTDILEQFDERVSPLLSRVLKSRAESRSLAQTRDLLLPKLMSGEIRLEKGEEAMETTA